MWERLKCLFRREVKSVDPTKNLLKPFRGSIEEARKDLSERLKTLEFMLKSKELDTFEHGELLEKISNAFFKAYPEAKEK